MVVLDAQLMVYRLLALSLLHKVNVSKFLERLLEYERQAIGVPPVVLGQLSDACSLDGRKLLLQLAHKAAAFVSGKLDALLQH